MNLPICPNYKEGKGCERSELRLLGENEQSFMFTCGCCHLLWAVSKPRTAAAARWENRIRQVKQATDRERELAARPKVFGRHYAGVRA